MRTFRKGLLGMAAAAALVAAAPTQEAVAAEDGYFYIWEHTFKGGKQCRWYGDDRDYRYNTSSTCNTWNEGANDIASSWWNNGYPGDYPDVLVFEHTDFRGVSICVRRGHYWQNLVEHYWNDRASSHKWATCG